MVKRVWISDGNQCGAGEKKGRKQFGTCVAYDDLAAGLQHATCAFNRRDMNGKTLHPVRPTLSSKSRAAYCATRKYSQHFIFFPPAFCFINSLTLKWMKLYIFSFKFWTQHPKRKKKNPNNLLICIDPSCGKLPQDVQKDLRLSFLLNVFQQCFEQMLKIH